MAVINLKKKYKEEIVAKLKEKFAHKNVMDVCKIEKVVINRGLGCGKDNQKFFESGVEELAALSGQKPLVTLAKKSIASFKIRKGMKIGAKVTLRGQIMYDFITKLIHISLPKIRDFKGVSPKAFDKNGNYTLGIKDQIIFPEINFEKVLITAGMDITFVIKSKSVEESKELLTEMGMPFRKSAAVG